MTPRNSLNRTGGAPSIGSRKPIAYRCGLRFAHSETEFSGIGGLLTYIEMGPRLSK
jgi:hypothetical protein